MIDFYAISFLGQQEMEKSSPFRHIEFSYGAVYGLYWCHTMVHFGSRRALEETSTIYNVLGWRIWFKNLVRAPLCHIAANPHEKIEPSSV